MAEKAEYPQRSQLIGAWRWVNTFGGFAGTTTPETAGYTETMVLTATGGYQLYRDDSLAVSGAHSYIDDRGLLIIRAQSRSEYSVSIAGDTLKMYIINVLDGYSHTYVRSQ